MALAHWAQDNHPMPNAVVLLSGGLDSTTALAIAQAEGWVFPETIKIAPHRTFCA